MRPDLNKIIHERSASGWRSGVKFARKSKRFGRPRDPDYCDLPFHERMRLRHGWPYHASINFHILTREVESYVGRPWNDFYSDLSRQFDKRSYRNHEMYRAFDWGVIEREVFVGDDGNLYTLNPYMTPPWRPLSENRGSVYVDPRDGIIRRIDHSKPADHSLPKKAIDAVIDEDYELHLIDGVWYHYDVKDVPWSEPDEFVKPKDKDFFFEKSIGIYSPIAATLSTRMCSWNELSDTEKRKQGVRISHTIIVTDDFDHNRIERRKDVKRDYWWRLIPTRYRTNKRTANKKQLRAAGITEPPPFVPKPLSRRQLRSISLLKNKSLQ